MTHVRRKAAPAVCLTLVLGAMARAGAAGATTDHGHFFFFVAPGGATADTRSVITGADAPASATWIHVGGGGEATLADRWGLGTDIGGVAQTHAAGRLANISVDGFFHPVGQRRRLDPYLAFGNSWFVREHPRRTLDAPNAGAGLNYWLAGRDRSRLGLKAEFRAYARGGRESLTYSELRVGVCVSQ